MNHKFVLLFSPVRSRGTAIFNSNLTAWGKYFGVSSPFATRLFAQASTILWKIPNVFALLNMIFKRSSTRLSSNGKQFITIEPTRIHTKDGRSHNGNLRYTIRPIEDAIHFYHERQGTKALDAICTHSAEMGFCLEFEPDLGKVWHFLRQAG